MSKIGIFGGSFDPVHLGHTTLIKQAITLLSLDHFIVIPTGSNPWKDTEYASAKERLEMLEIALKGLDKVSISTMEITNSNKKNYTIETLERVKQKHPKDTLYYIMGMDQASKFHLWKEATKISELVQLVVFDRIGYTKNENLEKYHFLHLDIAPMKVASSDIRHGDILDLDPQVLRYIVHHGLYLDTLLEGTMSAKRFAHSKSVATLAREIAKTNGVDPLKAYIAGMFHDIAKEMDPKKAACIMEHEFSMHQDKPYPIWHQWLSQYVCRQVYLLEDAEILQAIRHHTTASTCMSTLDMCIYVADKYDPLRDFDSSKEIALCKKDIYKGFKQSLIDFYEFSKAKNREIDPCFFAVYKKYVEEN